MCTNNKCTFDQTHWSKLKWWTSKDKKHTFPRALFYLKWLNAYVNDNSLIFDSTILIKFQFVCDCGLYISGVVLVYGDQINQLEKKNIIMKHYYVSVVVDFLLLLTFCLLLLRLWESVIVLCLFVRYFMFIQVMQSY